MARAKEAVRAATFVEVTFSRRKVRTGHKDTDYDRCKRSDRLSRYYDGLMAPDEHEEMNTHLADCRSCCRYLDDMAKTLPMAEKSRR